MSSKAGLPFKSTLWVRSGFFSDNQVCVFLDQFSNSMAPSVRPCISVLTLSEGLASDGTSEGHSPTRQPSLQMQVRSPDNPADSKCGGSQDLPPSDVIIH